MILFFTGTVTLFLSGFAVDSADRLYIGTANAIQVYEDGTLINQIDPQTDRSYVFTIDQDGDLLLSTSTEVYRMDLSGKVLEQREDRGAHVYNQIQARRSTFLSSRGDVYKMKNVLGRTKITKNDSQTVYQISVLSIIVKVLIAICVILLFLFPVWLIQKRKNGRNAGCGRDRIGG